MQFKITLRCLDAAPVLPLNYQYELSAWIYRVIEKADAEFAEFLHRRGHTIAAGRKSFKLFCFSNLEVPRREIRGDRLHILCPEIALVLGFYLDRTAEEFVRGLFLEQRVFIGDRAGGAHFSVQTVEMLPLQLPKAGQPVRLRTISPMVVAQKRTENELQNSPNERQEKYLSPDDPEFSRLFFINLLDKYEAATGQPMPRWWDASQFSFRLLSPAPKSRLVTIKSGTSAQTKVRGFLFDFELEVPPELLEVGLLGGFGKMNGEGFGCGVVF